MHRRVTLRSTEAQSALAVHGWSSIRFTEADQLSGLRDMALALRGDTGTGWDSSSETRDHDLRRCIDDELRPRFEPFVADALADYTILSTAILIKWPGADSVMAPHQDWTFVDEQHFRSVGLWVPLEPVSRANGVLGVLPGSHRVLDHPRCSPDLPAGHRQAIEGIKPDDLYPVRLAPGEGMIFDHRVVHGSVPNLTQEPRVVLAAALVPAEARLRHYYLGAPDRLDCFDIESADWFTTFDFGTRPAGKAVGSIPVATTTVTPEMLFSEARTLVDSNRYDISARGAEVTPAPPGRALQNLATAGISRLAQRAVAWRRSRSLGSRTAQVAPSASVAMATSQQQTSAEPPPAGSARKLEAPANLPPLLLDGADQKKFDQLGYVVIDLLEPHEIQRLQELYERLDLEPDFSSSLAAGFNTTIDDPRPEIRRRALEGIREIVDPALAGHVVAHQTLFANFLLKLSGGVAVPDHLDWSFVDERAGSSATVWCALVPTDERRGGLGVVEGSHQRVDFLRTVNVRDHERHAAAGVGCERVVLSVGPGQAVVMNNRLLHFSVPNEAPTDRLVAACVITAEDLEPSHYWVEDDGSIAQLTLSEEFFLYYAIGESPFDVPGVLEVNRIRDHDYG